MPDQVELLQLDSRGKPRVQTSFEGEVSLTVQSDAPLADIQEILRKYQQVGIVENLNTAEAMFLDISEFTDYADAMRHAKMAELDFMKLPSKIREIFGHDVGNWLDTAHDEDKRDALVKAGIIEGPTASGSKTVAEIGTKSAAGESAGGGDKPSE